jgi:hypothetical protein
VRPCFKAFIEERALPSAVLGPLDLAPLRREAAARGELGSIMGGSHKHENRF